MVQIKQEDVFDEVDSEGRAAKRAAFVSLSEDVGVFGLSRLGGKGKQFI